MHVQHGMPEPRKLVSMYRFWGRAQAGHCVATEVISFAEKIGLWDSSLEREDFSFADTYDPITFTGARLSDARVWSFLSKVAADSSFEKTYENYVLGHNVSASARMPLSVAAGVKISAVDLMSFMRNHYEPQMK